MMDFDRWYFGRRRHQVVRKRTRQKVARFRVCILFVKRRAHGIGVTTANLPVHHSLVKNTATVMGRDIAVDAYATAIRVNLDAAEIEDKTMTCLLYTSPSPRDVEESRMPSSA